MVIYYKLLFSGNIVKGWESIFTAKPKTQNQIPINTLKKTKFSQNEYIFSQSSLTNPCKKDDIPNLMINSMNF